MSTGIVYGQQLCKLFDSSGSEGITGLRPRFPTTITVAWRELETTVSNQRNGNQMQIWLPFVFYTPPEGQVNSFDQLPGMNYQWGLMSLSKCNILCEEPIYTYITLPFALIKNSTYSVIYLSFIIIYPGMLK